uniref:Cycle n=1 Tax=Timema genevievae TaxID=629358 RepID=A0A7R9JZG8_TIMGE|nr:unnamed protein product [Timema genevievae]
MEKKIDELKVSDQQVFDSMLDSGCTEEKLTAESISVEDYCRRARGGVDINVWSLHRFCDASQHVCAATVFLKVESSYGLSVQLVQTKERVFTIKVMTNPRLALLGVTIIGASQDSDGDDSGDDGTSVRTSDTNKKQNHSEIEKRRRDKMNTYITELSAMVPMCHAMSRKLDKLTVLRMAVQHISYTEGHYKPAFLSDQELKTLILQAAEGFLFVVGCDRGRILYVSESVSQILNYSQGDLLGQSWFDILHPKDVAKVKEQLSSSDLSPRERLIDAKTMLPVKTDMPQGVSRLCPGARRSFFCRMKCKQATQIKEEADTTTGCHRRKKQQHSDRKYSVIQCTGYLKSWAPAKMGLDEPEEGDGDSCNLSCLVAVGRLQPSITTSHHLLSPTSGRRPNLRPIQFISRHAMDGKFLFVDQRATLVLGFLPQELIGTSMYEYYQHEDIPHLTKSHKTVLQSPQKTTTQVYRFRSKEGCYIRLQSEWKSFRNPWTKDVEYLVAKNSLVL